MFCPFTDPRGPEEGQLGHIGAPGCLPLYLSMRTDSGSFLTLFDLMTSTAAIGLPTLSCQNFSVHKILLGASFFGVCPRPLAFFLENDFV